MQMRQEEPNNKIMRKGWTMKETIALFEAVKIHGTDWSRIVEILPGRSMDSVRNHWFRSQKRSVDEHPGIVLSPRALRPLAFSPSPTLYDSTPPHSVSSKLTRSPPPFGRRAPWYCVEPTSSPPPYLLTQPAIVRFNTSPFLQRPTSHTRRLLLMPRSPSRPNFRVKPARTHPEKNIVCGLRKKT